eukprot:364999-Chlamydomonas_euryale.AAC.5
MDQPLTEKMDERITAWTHPPERWAQPLQRSRSARVPSDHNWPKLEMHGRAHAVQVERQASTRQAHAPACCRAAAATVAAARQRARFKRLRLCVDNVPDKAVYLG